MIQLALICLFVCLYGAGFEVRAHEKYGHYFKNINTGEKQWHHPDDEEGY